MKNLLKKFVSLTMMFCLIIGGKVSVSNAQAMKGDLTKSEGAKEYVYTQEELNILNNKMRQMKNYEFGINGYDDGEYYALNVEPFLQIETYYCGPATVKQVEKYIKGTSKTQRTYAGILGTTINGTNMEKIARYLRSNVKANYVYQNIGDFNAWLNKVKYGAKNKMPAVLDINTNSVPWPYKTPGHFVNTSGYDTKRGFRVRITDPYGPGFGNRWYNPRTVYNANNAHWRKAMIW